MDAFRFLNSGFMRIATISVAAGTLSCPAFAGLGDDFGTRDPVACPVRTLPKTGAPSVLQATRYVTCDIERVGDTGENMYLVSDMQLQVAPKGRPYDPKIDGPESVGSSQPIYDIHGNFRLYRCGRKSSVDWQADPGHACRFQDFYDAYGKCWRDSHSDWHCALSYKFDIARTVHEAAPPQ